MKNKNSKIYIVIMTGLLIFSAIFMQVFTQAFQSNSFIGKGYYKVFDGQELIANIENMDALNRTLVEKYGDKMSYDIYLGDDISIEHTAYENKITHFTEPKEIVDSLQLQVGGLHVATESGKEFMVTSFGDWNAALQDTIRFIEQNDADKFNYDEAIKGDIKVAENFIYTNQRIPIEETMNREEVRKQIIYENVFDIKTDVVLSGDTVKSVADRNGISETQLSYANEINEDDVLVPGATLNVSEADYALDFSYPVTEVVVEEIAFEIEYQDDAEKFKDEEEVVQEGVAGTARAKYLSIIVNGKSIPGEQLEYEVLKKPVKKIIKRGTKERQSDSAWSIGTDAPYSNLAGFIWPAIGICISAEYGWYEYGRHYGLDIAGSTGESIWSVAAGTVEHASYAGAFGNYVVVDHHNGLKTAYAHLDSIGVNVGQEIGQGTYVGGMGRTGFVDGVHLHFEVHADGARLNPRGYLPAGGPSSC